MGIRSKILNAKAVDQKLVRLAWELYENNINEKEIVIVGIARRGVVLSEILANNLESISKIKTVLGKVILHKDEPYNNEIQLDLTVEMYTGKVVVLVDDVLNSGKTLMYGAKHFLNTPLKKLSTVVLVERNHNRYPVRADYVGISLSSTLKEYIKVELSGTNKGVYLV